MKQRICSQCAYGVSEPTFWMQQLSRGWPATLMCANSVESPGRLRAVVPNGVCRNFVVRRDPSYRLPPVEPATGDIRFIPLTRGKFAIVDAADYEWLSKYKWNAMDCGHTVYAFRIQGRKYILMHREIMKPRKGQVVDHINHNGADNRRSNLRNCSNRENTCNGRARPNSSSQYCGVSRYKTRWAAQIRHLGVRIHVGYFVEEIEAARARDRMAIMLHGEYAYLNLPEEWPPAKREALYNSPEAIQARAEAKRRSRKFLRAKRKAARAKLKSKPRRSRPATVCSARRRDGRRQERRKVRT